MTIRIKKGQANKLLLNQVKNMSGVDLDACYQCKKCSCGCTVSGHVQSPPSELIRRLQLGAGDELLENDLIWTCVSCETCFARCPMGIDMVSVMDALRTLAIEKKAIIPEGNVPLFNSAFLKTVKIFGRTYDLALMTAYKIGTSSYLRDTDKLPIIMKKKKIALLPSLGANRKTVRRIFKKTRQNKGRLK
ncbi:4Fe-4S dicluster domain-containing protein [bacterium]|nr:4Fe-4S dicluster domain-containing protein [bacterium]